MQKICQKFAEYAENILNMQNKYAEYAKKKYEKNICAHYVISDIGMGIVPERLRLNVNTRGNKQQQ